jgi:SAM-dependent methyltransferase
MIANDRVRGLIRRVVPAGVINLYWRLQRRSNRRRSVREVFTDVYERNLWGGAAGEYCSGAGSDEAHAEAYAEVVRDFIAKHDIRSVVDVGCGDFNVGRRLSSAGVRYTGVDVVEGLIEHNQAMHGGPGVRFLCIDATAEELPDGDLCLIRQVLQHLSNAQIQSVLERTRKFPYVLVTEHYPAPGSEREPNRDKPHGADTRIIDDSAVYLDRPPFDREVSGPLLEVDAGYWLRRPGETHRTYLLENR